MRFQNRRLINITFRYPELLSINKFLRVNSAVFDGELVVLFEGVPKFDMLQQREHITDLNKIEILSKLIPVNYVI